MTQSKSGTGTPGWLGQEHEENVAFAGGELWFGRHDGDGDILVFDPSEADAHAEMLRLYSLNQHRMRSFPRATVLERIPQLTDEAELARAQDDYSRRDALRSTHVQELETERDALMDRKRDEIIAAHQRRIESLGLPYEGVQDTPADHRPGRVSKCRACGIALDDFASTVCMACNAVLCSCGGCACKSTPAPS